MLRRVCTLSSARVGTIEMSGIGLLHCVRAAATVAEDILPDWIGWNDGPI